MYASLKDSVPSINEVTANSFTNSFGHRRSKELVKELAVTSLTRKKKSLQPRRVAVYCASQDSWGKDQKCQHLN